MSKAEIKDLLVENDYLGNKFRQFTCASCNVKYRATKLDSDRICPACSNGVKDECNSKTD